LRLSGAGTVVEVLREQGFGAQGFVDTADQAIARIFTEITGVSTSRVWLVKHMHNLLPYRTGYSAQDHQRLVAFQNMICPKHSGQERSL
jgi:hypothetical protein